METDQQAFKGVSTPAEAERLPGTEGRVIVLVLLVAGLALFRIFTGK